MDFQILEFKEIFWFISPEPGQADALSIGYSFLQIQTGPCFLVFIRAPSKPSDVELTFWVPYF
jgi:hypothetical protein